MRNFVIGEMISHGLGSAFAAVLSTFLLCAQASADERPPLTPVAAAAWNWTGFYLGGHVGALTGTTTFSDPDGTSLYGGTVSTPGFLAGLQLGYNWQFAPQWVIGFEADGSWLSSMGSNTCLQRSVTIIGSNCIVTPRALASLTGRLGFVTEPHGRLLLYGKAGVAWMRSDYSVNPNRVPPPGPYGADPDNNIKGIDLSDSPIQGDPTIGSIGAWGATVGLGLEYALTPKWSLKMEYDYLGFSGFGLRTPATTDVTTSGFVANLPSGFSNIVQDFHVAKLGLNYRFGAASKGSAYGAAESSTATWLAGWEIDVGGRFWYSWGKFQTANGLPNILVSRLTYSDVVGQSGELFARIDTPIDIFVKGFVGAGGLSRGKMYDEDWGVPPEEKRAGRPISYEVAQSDVEGTLHYLTADLGYNVLRGPDHKVGLFAGYNRYETTMNAMGCLQRVQHASGICAETVPRTVNGISETDTWHSLRVGVSAEARIWDHIKIAGDFAWLPYVKYDGLDVHRPNARFPVQGTGSGLQAEIFLSYLATESLSFSIGGRYWGMWTTSASQTDMPGNVFTVETDRYGVLVQATYKFRAPR